jgi:hypothetical protein
MADQSFPVKNQAYVFVTALVSQADANLFQNLPTLAVGDARINAYDGAVWSGWGNTTNAPAQLGERGVAITFTAPEMNNDIVFLVLHDAAGAEWQDQAWIFHPTLNPQNNVGIAAGAITAATFGAGAIDAAALAADAAQEIADTTLGRDFASVAGAAGRSLLNAARFLRNRWRIAGGALTVYEEDDATSAWTGPVTTVASDPVVEIDPT